MAEIPDKGKTAAVALLLSKLIATGALYFFMLARKNKSTRRLLTTHLIVETHAHGVARNGLQ
jgi:hypothetical protein